MANFGLTDEQARLSREKYGSNRLTETKSDSFWKKLLGNFGDPMIKILCVALVINVIFAILGKTHWYESVGIAVAVLLATFVSTFSEYQNENAFQKLQEEASRISCKVYRNNEIIEIPIDDIVIDDCLLLQAGDKIPADGLIVHGNIAVDQSVLNGESKEAAKDAIPDNFVDEETNLDFLNPYKVYRGSVVVSGNAVMRVTTIGDQTVYGEIAVSLQDDEERDSPLKVKLGKLAKQISMFGYIGGIAIALAFIFKQVFIANDFDPVLISAFASDWMNIVNVIVEAVMLGVIIIVVAVPEGLPLMIAIVSALNMKKMLQDHVLVRKIAGIETAGSLNILFSDKTGTITKGKLEAVTFISGDGKEYSSYDSITGGIKPYLSLSLHQNTTAVISGEGPEQKVLGGNATERAILGFAASDNANNTSLEVVESIPFNSTNKYSATQISGEYNYTLIKGAPEKLLANCRYYFDENGQKQPLNNIDMIESRINELAGRAIRVLAFAVSENALGEDSLPSGDWILVGIMGIRDEVRPESVTAIAEVQHAGVQVVMITGDRQDTAVAIAKEANLLTSPSDVILTSNELNQMSDDQIKEVLPNLRVIARALPSDKSRLVTIAQDAGMVVGMTGDGVNDSPALKKADVGFAMGSGTEVAKEASDIVIMDDNFSSIDKAILYGRTIFNSIRKFIIFQLTINVSAVLISFICPLIGLENPLTIIQMLWVNLVMDTLAALAFGGEPTLRRYMREKPKRRDESIVNGYMWSAIITGALWVVVLSLFLLLSQFSHNIFRSDVVDKYLLTGYFSFYIFAAVFNAFNARTDQLNLFENISQNHGFWRVMGIIVIVQVILTYIGGNVLRCYGLTGIEWVFILALAITVIPIDLIRKAIVNRKKSIS